MLYCIVFSLGYGLPIGFLSVANDYRLEKCLSILEGLGFVVRGFYGLAVGLVFVGGWRGLCVSLRAGLYGFATMPPQNARVMALRVTIPDACAPSALRAGACLFVFQGTKGAVLGGGGLVSRRVALVRLGCCHHGGAAPIPRGQRLKI